MFDNGSFLRRRKRYKRTSLNHNVPFPGVFSPFSPFWVRKPVPVLPMQFGAGAAANGFGGNFQDNFDMFSGANECFGGRGDVMHHKMGGYRGDDAMKPGDLIYDNRAKLEFLRRNMDAFRRSSQMDLFGPSALAGSKAEFFDSLNRETSLMNMRNGIGSYGGSSMLDDGPDIRRSNNGCDRSESTGKLYCHENDDGDDNDVDESNDKIDVVNESEDNDLSEVDRLSSDSKLDGVKVPSFIPFSGLCKPEAQLNSHSDHLPADDQPPNSCEQLSPDHKQTNGDNLILRVYSELSPEHNLFSSSRSSNASAEYMETDVEKMQWQSPFPASVAFAKKCFESTVLDYDFGSSQKKRKCGNAKGFSIENLIGGGNET